MSVGATSDTINEPKARDISVFYGRDEQKRGAFLVQVKLEGRGTLEFAIQDSEVLHRASVQFASAAARLHGIQEARLADLARTIEQDIDLADAGDDELINYITDLRDAARRAL